jgi:hypothetical protein
MTESQLRRFAKEHGYRFHRSTWRKGSIDNQGGYRLEDTATNLIIDGDRFSMTLEDVERRLTALSS